MEKCLPALLVGAALLVAVPSASASVIVLDIKGIVNLTPVGAFDDGGGDTDDGLEFSPAVVDDDAGGTGNIASDALLDTAVFPQDANDSSLVGRPGGGSYTGIFSSVYVCFRAASV